MPPIHTLSPGHVTKQFTDKLTDPVLKILTIVSCMYEQWIRGHYFYFSGSVKALLAVAYDNAYLSYDKVRGPMYTPISVQGGVSMALRRQL